MFLPSNLQTGRVEWRAVADIIDGPDEDTEPDIIPAQGEIWFDAEVKYWPAGTAEGGPMTIVHVQKIAIIDSEGFLCSPDPQDPTKAGPNRFMRLYATNDPDYGVTGWKWKATPRLKDINGKPLMDAVDPKEFFLEAGTTLDLTHIFNKPLVGGPETPLLVAEGVAAAAAASASSAANSAEQSRTLAASVADRALANDIGVAEFLRTGAKTTSALSAAIREQNAPLIAPMVASYIASNPAIVDAAAAAVDANPKITALENTVLPKVLTDAKAYADSTNWKRPEISTGSLNTYFDRGVYDVVSNALVSDKPFASVGELTVSGKTYPMHSYVTWESVPRHAVRRYVSNAWSAWQPLSWRNPYLLAGTDVDSLVTPGAHGFGVKGLLNLPQGCGDVGVVEVLQPSATVFSHRLTDWISGNQWYRSKSAAGVWSVWKKTGGDFGSLEKRVDAVESAAAPSLDVGVHQHLMREVDLRRRIGRVSTGNKAAVALIFDHGTKAFETKVLPLLRKYNMRATLALNSRMMDANLPIYEAEVNDWGIVAAWQKVGIEFANHTGSHENASGYQQIKDEIIGGREILEASLNGAGTAGNGVYVDSFVQPGTRRTTIPGGDGANAFDGFADGLGVDKYFTTTAGRLIIDGHACVSGAIPHYGQVYPLDGQIQIGSNGRWIDNGADGIASVNAMLADAVARKGRCIIRSHPQYVDLSSSYINVAQMDDFLQSLAARRDAGELVILPFREWNIANL